MESSIYNRGMNTKEQRRKTIETAIGIAKLGGSDVSENFKMQANRYIEGEISFDEFESLVYGYWDKLWKLGFTA